MQFLARQDFPKLLESLITAGYQCIAPQIREGAIVYDKLQSVAQLPQGYRDDQQPAHYQLEQTDDVLYFGWAVGVQALKPLTFAPRESLWTAQRDAGGQLTFVETHPETVPTAVIGVRACDLAALHLQDQHFAYNSYSDTYYNARRRQLFLISVDCAFPASTCFCASTGDGPSAQTGFDIALTEFPEGFLVRSKSSRAEAILATLPLSEVSETQQQAALAQNQQAIEKQTRHLPSRNLKAAFFANLEHERWQDIATRCLACGNCTSVCPTCFCHSESAEPTLDGSSNTQYRQWDSCFTLGHSYMHSFVLRDNILLRYRQWLTHKLGSWHDQYGRSGCVGCGRCLTWCPVGIDITVEAQAICGESL